MIHFHFFSQKYWIANLGSQACQTSILLAFKSVLSNLHPCGYNNRAWNILKHAKSKALNVHVTLVRLLLMPLMTAGNLGVPCLPCLWRTREETLFKPLPKKLCSFFCLNCRLPLPSLPCVSSSSFLFCSLAVAKTNVEKRTQSTSEIKDTI